MTEGVCAERGGQTYHAELECEAYEPDDAHRYLPREAAEEEGLDPCDRCVDKLSGRWRRRGLLTAIAAGGASLAAVAPLAHAEATLDADVELVDWRAEGKVIHHIRLGITNHETDPLDPVIIPWGRSRQSQLPWKHDTEGIPSGERREVLAVDPGWYVEGRQSTGLFTGYTNTVRVYDSGTEARAALRFSVGEPPEV
jgi:hypothetical protein